MANVFETEARNLRLSLARVQSDSFEKLQHGDLDLIIGMPPKSDYFETCQLLRDRFMCASWAGNTTIDEGMTLEEFARNGHWICKPDGYCLTAAQRKGVSLGMGSTPSISMAEGTSLLPFLILGTGYVTLIPERIGKLMRLSAPVRMFEPPFPVEDLVLWASWHPRSSGDPGHLWLRDCLKEIACRGAN